MVYISFAVILLAPYVSNFALSLTNVSVDQISHVLLAEKQRLERPVFWAEKSPPGRAVLLQEGRPQRRDRVCVS
jgi:hypothetical protein